MLGFRSKIAFMRFRKGRTRTIAGNTSNILVDTFNDLEISQTEFLYYSDTPDGLFKSVTINPFGSSYTQTFNNAPLGEISNESLLSEQGYFLEPKINVFGKYITITYNTVDTAEVEYNGLQITDTIITQG